MPETIDAILNSWPAIKGDLEQLLRDPDNWIIANLKVAHKNGDRARIDTIIEIMEFFHNLSHSH